MAYDITKKKAAPRQLKVWYKVFRAGYRNPAYLALRTARKELQISN
jgi:hypothetical protein